MSTLIQVELKKSVGRFSNGGEIQKLILSEVSDLSLELDYKFIDFTDVVNTSLTKCGKASYRTL